MMFLQSGLCMTTFTGASMHASVIICSCPMLSSNTDSTHNMANRRKLEASNVCTAAKPLKVLTCTKRSVSASPVISAKPAVKWAVNRVNSGHMYTPVFNYLAVNPAKRSPSLVHSTAAHPCSSSLPLFYPAFLPPVCTGGRQRLTKVLLPLAAARSF